MHTVTDFSVLQRLRAVDNVALHDVLVEVAYLRLASAIFGVQCSACGGWHNGTLPQAEVIAYRLSYLLSYLDSYRGR